MDNEPKKYLSYIVIFALFIIICITLGKRASDYAQNTTRTKWIARCEEARSEERACRISEKESDFQKALAKSIIKMQPKLDEVLANRISVKIITSCKSKKLDPIMITALIWVESMFDPLAHSNKGAVGLMQVRYTTWKGTPILKGNGVGAKYKLYHIDLNIKCGIEIFAEYYEKSEYNVVKTLYRYNSGAKDLPEGKQFYEIDYANKIIITACNIRESIRKDKEVKVLDHKK
jgi:hypothetical protein